MSEGMAQRIKALRQDKGLTLEQVASVVGVGKSTVRKWETGMIANMKRDKIASLAKHLELLLNILWVGIQRVSPPPSRSSPRENKC